MGRRLPSLAARGLSRRKATRATKAAAPKPGVPDAWQEAGRRHRLSPRHVEMARALGLNPKKLGSLDNHRQEAWKAPLPQFIEELYAKRFGRR